MPRQVPILLQDHLNSEVRTLAYLLKIITRGGQSLGVTSHDSPITFNDGGGALTYSSIVGLTQAAVSSDSTLEVMNSEALLLISDSGLFTDEEVEAGVLDFARFIIYRVNWEDLSQGYYIVQAGTTGAVRNVEGMIGVIELRGLAQPLRQTFVELYSITCRASFGSQVGVAHFPCTFDAESLWGNYTVSGAGAEAARVLSATASLAATGPNGALPFVPGLIQFLTGANAGAYTETEVVSGAYVELRFPVPYDIQIGDTFRARPDCGKRWTEDCGALYNNRAHFRGEPLIPVVGRG